MDVGAEMPHQIGERIDRTVLLLLRNVQDLLAGLGILRPGVGDALQTEEISVQLNKTNKHNLVYTPSDTEYSGLAELTVLGLSEEYPDGNEIFSAHVLSITPIEE